MEIVQDKIRPVGSRHTFC